MGNVEGVTVVTFFFKFIFLGEQPLSPQVSPVWFLPGRTVSVSTVSQQVAAGHKRCWGVSEWSKHFQTLWSASVQLLIILSERRSFNSLSPTLTTQVSLNILVLSRCSTELWQGPGSAQAGVDCICQDVFRRDLDKSTPGCQSGSSWINNCFNNQFNTSCRFHITCLQNLNTLPFTETHWTVRHSWCVINRELKQMSEDSQLT